MCTPSRWSVSSCTSQIQHQAILRRAGDADHQAAGALGRRQYAVAMDRMPLEPVHLAGAANPAAARRWNFDAETEKCRQHGMTGLDTRFDYRARQGQRLRLDVRIGR